MTAASVMNAGPTAAQSGQSVDQTGATNERVIGTFRLRPSADPEDAVSGPTDSPLTNVRPSPLPQQRQGGAPTNASDGSTDPLDILQAALTAMKVGEDTQARELLRRVIDIAPDSPEANRARRHLQELGGGQSAVARLPKSPEVAPQLPQSSRRQGGQSEPVQGRRLASFEQEFISIAGDRVFFGLGSSKLGGRARRVLAGQAQWLNKQRDLSLLIEGHADDGSMAPEQQQVIAKARAEVVYDRLVQEGVDPRRLEVRVLGRAQPVATCSDQACAAQNRRVVSVLRVTPAWNSLPTAAQSQASDGAGVSEVGRGSSDGRDPIKN